jgi:hypothetical protein
VTGPSYGDISASPTCAGETAGAIDCQLRALRSAQRGEAGGAAAVVVAIRKHVSRRFAPLPHHAYTSHAGAVAALHGGCRAKGVCPVGVLECRVCPRTFWIVIVSRRF